MKQPISFIVTAALCALAFVGCSKASKPEPAPEPEPVIEIKTDAQKTGYSIGVDNGQNLLNQFKGVNVDMKAMASGFSDELNGRPRKYPDEVIGKNVEAMRRKIMDKVETQFEPAPAGYAVGIDHAFNLKQQFQGQAIDLPAMAQGFTDEIHGRPKKIAAEDVTKAIDEQRRKMIDQMMADGMKAKSEKNKGSGEAEKNLAEGKKFLEENARKEGVKTTPSGLQYTVVKEGTGPQPTATGRVTVHYQGTFLNGKVFDSSYVRNKPMTFGLSEVIKGWTEGLQLMKEGSKYKLFIPADLAYGDFGAPGMIGPNATLVFDVELLKVEQ